MAIRIEQMDMDITCDEVRVPLRIGGGGVALVGDTDVPLETVISEFIQGADTLDICQKHRPLLSGEVSLVIGYYLARREEVEEYMRRRGAMPEPAEGEPQDAMQRRVLNRARRLGIIE